MGGEPSSRLTVPDDDAVWQLLSRPPAGPGVATYALLMAAGIVAARWWAGNVAVDGTALALIVSVIALAVAWRAHHPRPALAEVGLCIAVIGAAGAWTLTRDQHISPDDLAAAVHDETVLVRLRGRVASEPVLLPRASGPMARFDYRPPATFFRLNVVALRDRANELYPVSGRVLVRVDEALPPLRVGDEVDVAGYLTRSGRPYNPGGFDYQQYARNLGQAGIISVSSRELVQVVHRHRAGIAQRWQVCREAARQRASGWLLADLPPRDLPDRDALLVALLLGERAPALDGLMQTFQHLGVAHLLAISGLHLGILAGLVFALTRMLRLPMAAQGIVIIVATLAYLFVIDVRMPVLRAGVMTIAASLGIACVRRVRVRALVAFSAIGLLLWRPDQLFSAGFQLSYGVVLGLIYFVDPVRTRWFGPPNNAPASVAQMLCQWFATAATVAVVAWMVATPIAMYHFGLVAIAGVPLTLALLPVVTVLLVLGCLKVVLALMLPSAALVIGYPLSDCADVMMLIVRFAETLPGMFCATPFPSAMWVLAALGSIGVWSLARSPRMLRAGRWSLAALVVIAAGEANAPLADGVLRIDMLSVGDGTCILLRSGSEAVLFDAGSNTDLDAGRRRIIPALKSLGVAHLDAIIISHANLDHYAAVVDIVYEFDVGEVICSPQFLRAEETERTVQFLLERIRDAGVPVRACAAGDVRALSQARMSWIHPDAEDRFANVNDTSMVIAIDVAGRRVLLTGDIQDIGIGVLRMRYPDMVADIAELPHHGSFRPAAVDFMHQISPGVVLQSTGGRRMRRDRWQAALPAGTQRRVTHEHGMISVVIDRDGTVRTMHHLEDEG